MRPSLPSFRFATAAGLFLVLAGRSLAAAPAPQSIFDGRSLAGWEGNAQHWRVEDGAITGTIPDGQRLAQHEFLYWKGEVADFELTAEFRISGAPSANSGIMFRAQKGADGRAAGYRADLDQGAVRLGRIHDEQGRALLVERGARVSIAPDGRRWTEEFGKPADFLSLPKPPGEWNTYRILADASHVEVWINGRRVAVLDDHQTNAADFAGLLALQLHSGPGPVKVQFRNLQLTTLGRTALPPRPTPLAARAAPAEKSIGVARKNGDPPLRRVAGVDDVTRVKTSPVLWHLRDNPAPPTAVAHAAAQKLVAGIKLVDGFQAELVAAEPDLHQPVAFAFDGTWRNGLDYFLENIIDPNAVVGTAFELNIITKRDGSVVSGMIDRETDTAVVVRTVTETVNVPKSEIKDRQKTPQSLMPPGLLEALPEREQVELLKFLTTQ